MCLEKRTIAQSLWTIGIVDQPPTFSVGLHFPLFLDSARSGILDSMKVKVCWILKKSGFFAWEVGVLVGHLPYSKGCWELSEWGERILVRSSANDQYSFPGSQNFGFSMQWLIRNNDQPFTQLQGSWVNLNISPELLLACCSNIGSRDMISRDRGEQARTAPPTRWCKEEARQSFCCVFLTQDFGADLYLTRRSNLIRQEPCWAPPTSHQFIPITLKVSTRKAFHL